MLHQYHAKPSIGATRYQIKGELFGFLPFTDVEIEELEVLFEHEYPSNSHWDTTKHLRGTFPLGNLTDGLQLMLQQISTFKEELNQKGGDFSGLAIKVIGPDGQVVFDFKSEKAINTHLEKLLDNFQFSSSGNSPKIKHR